MNDYWFEDTTREFSFETNRRLREHRRRLGFSLPYVAETLGITEDQLKAYEEGTKLIPFEVISKFGTLYNISPGYFLGDFDNLSQRSPVSSKHHTLF